MTRVFGIQCSDQREGGRDLESEYRALKTESSPKAVFRCLRCGNCCRHEGEVRLQDGEPEAMAGLLGLTVEEFTARYTRLREDRQGLSLLDAPDGACIFLDGTPPACRIQTEKPRQCRDFPIGWKYTDLEQVCQAAQQSDGS